MVVVERQRWSWRLPFSFLFWACLQSSEYVVVESGDREPSRLGQRPQAAISTLYT